MQKVWDGSLGFNFGLLWPRQVYARVIDELTEQGAIAVAFDVVFGELRPDHPPVNLASGSLIDSDQFFATLSRLLQEQLGERLDLPASAITEAVIEEN